MNKLKTNLFKNLEKQELIDLYKEYELFEQDVIKYNGPLRYFINEYSKNDITGMGLLQMSIDLLRTITDTLIKEGE